MSALIRLLKGFDRGVAALELTVAIISLTLMLTFTTLPIVFRLAKGSSVDVWWATPVSLYLLLTSTFLGASLALRARRHIQIDLITRGLPRRGKAGFGIIAGIVAAVILGALCVAAIHHVQVNWDQQSKLRGIPLGPVQMAMPFALAVMAFRSLLGALEDLRGVMTGELGYMAAFEHTEGADLAAGHAGARPPSGEPAVGSVDGQLDVELIDDGKEAGGGPSKPTPEPPRPGPSGSGGPGEGLR